MRNRPLLIIAFLLLILSSCKGEDASLEYIPEVSLPIQEMNQDLHLILDPAYNSFEMGDPVAMIVYNSSKHPVTLGSDFGLHIYKKVDDQWISVFEGPEGIDFNYWILANGSEDQLQEFMTVIPEIYSQDPVEIRFVIVGNFVRRSGELGKEVGTYADFTLSPKQYGH